MNEINVTIRRDSTTNMVGFYATPDGHKRPVLLATVAPTDPNNSGAFRAILRGADTDNVFACDCANSDLAYGAAIDHVMGSIY